MLRAAATRRLRRPPLRSAALGVVLALAAAACDREVSVLDDDPMAVEAANAGMDALLVEGPTARRVAAHRLTTERVERWFAAQEALDAQAADDPALGGYGTGGRGDDAIERAVAALEGRPGAEAAIGGAGLTVEEFVLTGLALHQALTASGPAAPTEVRRLAARNARFVAENADLLARFRTQRPTYVAEAPAEDSVGWYDPFADTLVYDYGYDAATAPPPDSVVPDSLPPPVDTLPPPVLPPSPAPVVPPPVPVVPPPTTPPAGPPPPATPPTTID